MPVIRHPGELTAEEGPGWSRQAWAGPDVFGVPVPMTATRCRVSPAAGMDVALAGQEAFAYVISGDGTAISRDGAAIGGGGTAGGEEFPLARESVLWLAGGGDVRLAAGPAGLDVLVAEAAGAGPVTPLRTLFDRASLPHLTSTRDTRDRLDLVTENVPVEARRIRADRILYHPGDTAAAHYHADCHHVFCVLTGSGLLYSGEHSYRLEAGMSALVGPGEEHWFENDRQAEFSFAEFWAPPPSDTVWTVTGDRCTWAPAG